MLNIIFRIKWFIFIYSFGILCNRIAESNSIERSSLSVSNSVDDSYEILRQFRQEEAEYDEDVESSTKQPSNETALNVLFNQVIPAVNGVFKQFTGGNSNNGSILSSAQSAVKEFQQAGAGFVKPFTTIEIPVAGAVKEATGIVKQLTSEGGLVSGAVKEFQLLFGAILDEFEPKLSTVTSDSKSDPSPTTEGQYPFNSNSGTRYPDIVDEAYGEVEITVPPTTAATYAETVPTVRTVKTTSIKTPTTTEIEPTSQTTHQQKIRYKIKTTPNPFLNQEQLIEAVIQSKIIPNRIRTTSEPIIDDEDREEDEDLNVTIEPSRLAAYLSKYQYNKLDSSQSQHQQTIAPGTISKDMQFPTTKPHVHDNEIIDLLHSVSSSLKNKEKLRK